ncbi:hypothetical protein [Natronoglycomyces albus]|uniref:Uncharacterized protein n=1 Tax=Natronoglycomyces albus TaxID=2811108 RepID=A0A895XTP4_9ACTN|nr:hypothetical protein [Natronoglycomyces albus]QSB06685.1 hypothetical protein JQS30_07265 [Natronoglycomyces albus]
MSSAVERKALAQNSLPLLARVHQLIERYPRQPVPEAQIRALAKNHWVCPRSRPESPAAADDFLHIFHTTDPACDSSVRALQLWLRLYGDVEALIHRLNHEARLCSVDKARSIGHVLLYEGLSFAEVAVGLHLLSYEVAEDDARTARTIALLGSPYLEPAIGLLARSPHLESHVEWIAERTGVHRLPQPTYTHISGSPGPPRVLNLGASMLAADASVPPGQLKSPAQACQVLALLLDLPFGTASAQVFRSLNLGVAALTELASISGALSGTVVGLEFVARVHESVVSGNFALLPWQPGDRERYIAQSRACLTSAQTHSVVSAALRQDASDARACWLYRYVARLHSDVGEPQEFSVRIVVPPPGHPGRVETRILAAGRPLVSAHFPFGPAMDPQSLLTDRSAWLPAAPLSQVVLAEASCTTPCCGALTVDIRHEGHWVVWDVRNSRQPEVSLAQYRFPSDSYLAEIDRAATDGSWEWPAHRAARKLETTLRQHPSLLKKWGFDSSRTGAQSGVSEQFWVTFSDPVLTNRPSRFTLEFSLADAAVVDDAAIGQAVGEVISEIATNAPDSTAFLGGNDRLSCRADVGWPERPRHNRRSVQGKTPSLYARLIRLCSQEPFRPITEAERDTLWEQVSDATPPAGCAESTAERICEQLIAVEVDSQASLGQLAQQLQSVTPTYSLTSDLRDMVIPISDRECRRMATYLLREGLTKTELVVGLRLLRGRCTGEEAPLVRTIALMGDELSSLGIEALDNVPQVATHLIWIAAHADGSVKASIAKSLCSARWTYQELLNSVPDAGVRTSLVLSEEEIAATVAEILLALPDGWEAWDSWSTCDPVRSLHGPVELLVHVAQNLVRFTSDIAALGLALRLRESVYCGHLATLPWKGGQRKAVLTAFEEIFSSARVRDMVTDAARTGSSDSYLCWIRRELTRYRPALTKSTSRLPSFAMHVSVGPPSGPHGATVEFLIDGMPLVANLFQRGSGAGPSTLLSGHSPLLVTAQPREVSLAEAWCTAGCCGQLWAKMWLDDAETVVWEVRDSLAAQGEVTVYRFDAAAYQAEVARAHGEWDWEWPAARVARQVATRLEDDPHLLGQWNCTSGWADSYHREPTQLRVLFTFPATASTFEDHLLQFVYDATIDDAAVVDDDAVTKVVDQICSRFEETNPTSISRVCGGSADSAAALGFPWYPDLRR